MMTLSGAFVDIYEELMDCRPMDGPDYEAHEKLSEVLPPMGLNERKSISYIYCIPRKKSVLGKPFFGIDIRHLGARLHTSEIETLAILDALRSKEMIRLGDIDHFPDEDGTVDVAISDFLSYVVKESSERALRREEFEEQATSGWRLEKVCYDNYDWNEDEFYYEDPCEQDDFTDEYQED